MISTKARFPVGVWDIRAAGFGAFEVFSFARRLSPLGLTEFFVNAFRVAVPLRSRVSAYTSAFCPVVATLDTLTVSERILLRFVSLSPSVFFPCYRPVGFLCVLERIVVNRPKVYIHLLHWGGSRGSVG